MATTAFPLPRGEALEKQVGEHAVKIAGITTTLEIVKEDTADNCAEIKDITKFIASQAVYNSQIAWLSKLVAGAVILAIIGAVLAMILK